MKFQLILLLFSFFYNPLSAQDSTYYLPAHNKSDDSLKYELNQIIKNHTEFEYKSSSTDVWDILKYTDRDTANPDNVILIYSGRSVDKVCDNFKLMSPKKNLIFLQKVTQE